MPNIDKTMRLIQIEITFSNRTQPSKYIAEKVSADEALEVLAIAGKDWKELTGTLLEHNFEVLHWLSPEVFCYYLGGILYASVKEHSPDLLVIFSIINMLDRTPDPAYWDAFFSDRWLVLNLAEIDVLSDWILWLADFKIYDDISLSRALNCLQAIKQHREHRNSLR